VKEREIVRILVTGGSGFIGTHLIELVRRERPAAAICNIDLVAPKLKEHERYWVKGDILKADQLLKVFSDFQPTHIVHMAARTDANGTTLEYYKVNTVGSANVISAIRQTPGIEKIIFISTQYVVGPGIIPTSIRDHNPHTVYGQSKCVMENMIYDATLSPQWTIVRPTNIWGSWHPRYAQEFWLVLKRGRYVHPGGKGVHRAYGYVGNIVEQMWAIFHKERSQVDKQIFYVGDPVDDIIQWVSAFSIELTGKKPKVVPRFVLKTIALVGDAAIKVGFRSFPLFSSRYQSMTQEYLVDMEPTFKLLGKPKYSLQEGVKHTSLWLKTQGEIWR
jgi:nucleoside-diphosphate-sugar epimerase